MKRRSVVLMTALALSLLMAPLTAKAQPSAKVPGFSVPCVRPVFMRLSRSPPVKVL
jgi:hypothetical protein